MSTRELVMSKILVTHSCWEWTAARDRKGYGRVAKHSLAHRAVYELLVGPIPEGLDLDHLCRNHGCVFPLHLEPVTRRENLLRGATIPARKAAQTCCEAGHEFDDANTYIAPNGTRMCRACHRLRQRNRYKSDPDAALKQRQYKARRLAEMNAAADAPA